MERDWTKMTQEEIKMLLEMGVEKPAQYPPLKEGATDLEFLEWLGHDLWEKKPGTSMMGGRTHHYTYLHERRKITADELDRVKEVIAASRSGGKDTFVVEPVNACMGFNFGVNIYAAELEPDEEEFALEHGIKITTRPVLSITGHHTDTRFEETWKLLSPLSHNSVNEALLRRYGLGQLREKGYYDY
jgi:hypothetical protein